MTAQGALVIFSAVKNGNFHTETILMQICRESGWPKKIS
jgi:hypothetical protein